VKISLNVDPARWLALPRLSEDSAEARQWEDTVIDGMKAAWQGALDSPSEPFIREALRNGLRHVSEDDSVTLQYWPDASIVNAIVHIAAAPFAPGEPRQGVPLADIHYFTQPVTSVFETDALGSGVEALYLTTVHEQSPIKAGGVNYLFQNDFGFVAVGVEPTLPGLIGIMLEPLREVVRDIHVVDDAEGNWQPATVDEAALLSRGEQWLAEVSNQIPATARTAP